MPDTFFDASAIIRVWEADPRFEAYQDEPITTDRGHVLEFAKYLVKAYGAKRARESLAQFRHARIEPTDDDLVEAAKLVIRSRDVSNQDALGFVLAQREGLDFLTTDRAFRGLRGAVVVDVR